MAALPLGHDGRDGGQAKVAKRKVFISYARQDKPDVDQLVSTCAFWAVTHGPILRCTADSNGGMRSCSE